MNILNDLLNEQNGQGISQLANQFGLEQSQATNAIKNLLPALTMGLKKNMHAQGGLDSLLGALEKGNHSEYLDRPETLSSSRATSDGNNILGHILGSKSVSREVTRHAAQNTGIGQGILKKMLPIVASMVMSSLSKNAMGQGYNRANANSQTQSGLDSFLDFDGDGSAIDDLFNMARKFF